MAGASVIVYNSSNQIVKSGETDGDGFIHFDWDEAFGNYKVTATASSQYGEKTVYYDGGGINTSVNIHAQE